MILTAEGELQEIEARVNISKAARPTGFVAIRNVKGCIVKTASTARELYQYIASRLPNWRRELSTH